MRHYRKLARWVACCWLLLAAGPLWADCLEQALDDINSPANELAITDGPLPGQYIFERRDGEWGQQGHRSRLFVYDCQSRNVSGPLVDGLADAGDPYFDAASNQLWLTSRGPAGGSRSDADIFVAIYQDGEWMMPKRLPSPLNSEADEYSPIPRQGGVYFASGRGGDGNLYLAKQHDQSWEVSALGSGINAATGEWNLWVSDNERLLVFEASGRPENITVSGDLYITRRGTENNWLPSRPLWMANAIGSQLNPRKIGNRLVYASSAGRTHTDLVMVSSDLALSVPGEVGSD